MSMHSNVNFDQDCDSRCNVYPTLHLVLQQRTIFSVPTASRSCFLTCLWHIKTLHYMQSMFLGRHTLTLGEFAWGKDFAPLLYFSVLFQCLLLFSFFLSGWSMSLRFCMTATHVGNPRNNWVRSRPHKGAASAKVQQVSMFTPNVVKREREKVLRKHLKIYSESHSGVLNVFAMVPSDGMKLYGYGFKYCGWLTRFIL